MKYIYYIVFLIAMTGMLIFKESENNLLHVSLLLVFLFGLISLIYKNKNAARLKIKSGISIIKYYSYYDGMIVLFTVCGVLILSIALYNSYLSGKIQSWQIGNGILLCLLGFMNIAKHWITIIDNKLKIQGSTYTINNITEVRITDEHIQIVKGKAIDNFNLGRLNKSEKNELYEFLLKSSLGNKVQIGQQ